MSDDLIELELTLTFRGVVSAAVELCSPGIALKIWSKPQLDELFLYAPSRHLNRPPVARFPKDAFLSLASNWEHAKAVVRHVDGSTVAVCVNVRASASDVEADAARHRAPGSRNIP